MKTIQKPWIKLKESIDHEDYDLINKLQEQCFQEDQTTLKLELDYKLGVSPDKNKPPSIEKVNEFMYFDGQELIGYIGVCSFGGAGSPIEVNGMVHPEYRLQGVFKTLFDRVIVECKRRNASSVLLLSDRKSNAGQQFIKGTGARYKHTEYEMYLKEDNIEPLQRGLCGISFRKATHADASEIVRQNAIYFNNNDQDIAAEETEMIISDEDRISPEDEEKGGMTVYLAEKDREMIGKVHIQLNYGLGGIYGLGVLPEHRGKGFGRAIVIMAIEKLKEANAREIMLQVVDENSNAIHLYKSCNFVETSTMDYYEILLPPVITATF